MDDKRETAVYVAVSNSITDARIAIAKKLQGHPEGPAIDDILYTAQNQASTLALEAAKAEEAIERTEEQENFAISLTERCPTHREWLTVVRFGLSTLLEQQSLLAEIVVREATREAERAKDIEGYLGNEAAGYIARVLLDLGLKLTV